MVAGSTAETPSSSCVPLLTQIFLRALCDRLLWRLNIREQLRRQRRSLVDSYRPPWLPLPPPLPCLLFSGVGGKSGPGIRLPSGLPPRCTAWDCPAGRCAIRQLSAPGPTRRQRGRLSSEGSVLLWGKDSLWRVSRPGMIKIREEKTPEKFINYVIQNFRNPQVTRTLVSKTRWCVSWHAD